MNDPEDSSKHICYGLLSTFHLVINEVPYYPLIHIGFEEFRGLRYALFYQINFQLKRWIFDSFEVF